MDIKKGFKREVLANGLTIVFEKRDLPVTSMCIAVRNGGINENSGEKGISHFIEHMMYKGTPSRSSFQIAEEIEKKGGEINGFTDEEITAYWCKVPAKYSDEGLDVLFDIIKNSLFSEEEVEKERRVILEEIKARADSPRVYSLDKIKSLLYQMPFAGDIIGTKETILKIKREDLLKRFKEIYAPNNLILCVVGNYDFKKIKKRAQKEFWEKEGKSKNYPLKKTIGSLQEKRKGIDQASLVFAYHSPLFSDKLSVASEVLMTIMAEGMSSRLFREIREKRNLAYSVLGHVDSRKYYGYSIIYVGTKKENVAEVESVILKEFEDLSRNLTLEELDKTKEQLIGNYELSMEDSQGQMLELLLHESLGDASRFYDYEKEISSVTLEEVKSLASKVKKGSYSFFALLPED